MTGTQEALEAGDVLARYDRPGPRYTSYPTAVSFSEAFGADQHTAALRRLGDSGRPTSLYVHLPFCEQLCHYCACNVVVSRDRKQADAYLDLLEREAALVEAAIGRRVPVTQLHLGGGTPTFFRPEQLARLYRILSRHTDLSAVEEAAVEVDPRVTTPAHLETLRALGWNRISVGVQDLDPEVQRAIRRIQSVEQTAGVVEEALRLGFSGVNVDLVYGLPFQTLDGFAETLQSVVDLDPDRVALYSYAHVPWMRPAQAAFDRRGFPRPDAEGKRALFRHAAEVFRRAGYRHLGLDHFAKPYDELARAQVSGELHRNFQGYTVRRARDLVGLGVTAISDVAGAYGQSTKELGEYRAALEGCRLPTVRGWRLDADDQRRRRVITDVMTGRGVSAEDLAGFPEARAALEELAADGLVVLEDGLEVTELGRFFLRNVAMCFDAELPRLQGERFSRTV